MGLTVICFNSLTPGRCVSHFKSIIFKLIVQNYSLRTHFEIALSWMPQNLTNEKSTLVREWLGAVTQQAITLANVDPDLCRHMASLSHNELPSSEANLS